LLRLFYPDGIEEPIASADGKMQFTSYKVSAEQMAAFHTLAAQYTPLDGSPAVTRSEPGLGTQAATSAPEGGWVPPPGLHYPATVTWTGGLVAPTFGIYTFGLDPGARLELDGRAVLGGA